jgi:hypothetical protein
VGLLEQPQDAAELTHLVVEALEGTIEVLVDERFLSTHVREGALLFSVEGHGRFRLHLPGERPAVFMQSCT